MNIGTASLAVMREHEYTDIPDNIEDVGEDSSEDDASGYIANSNFIVTISLDETCCQEEAKNRKRKEFATWIRKYIKKAVDHKLYLCGNSATKTGKQWLNEMGVQSVDFDFHDIHTASFTNALISGSVVVVSTPSIIDVMNAIDQIANIQQNNIIFCCDDAKNCPRNKGTLFSTVFKRITLK